MAAKPAKMANRSKGNDTGEKIKNRVTGGPLTGYTVINEAGESVTHFHKMWDAINEKKRLDFQ